MAQITQVQHTALLSYRATAGAELDRDQSTADQQAEFLVGEQARLDTRRNALAAVDAALADAEIVG